MALCVEIKVVCQSGRSALIVDKSGILKCFVKAAPEKGKANAEVIKTVSKAVGVAQHCVTIVGGLTSRKKLLKLESDITYEKLLLLLGSGSQAKII